MNKTSIKPIDKCEEFFLQNLLYLLSSNLRGIKNKPVVSLVLRIFMSIFSGDLTRFALNTYVPSCV